MPSLPLNEHTLALHAARVSVPAYDRGALARGVVHISVGSFHRSHQAVYFDELARRGLGEGWAVTGVGLHRRDMQLALEAQDGLYTVVARGAGGDEARVVGAITRYLFAPDHPGQVDDTLADARTRLVTLTITPGGYHVDPETGAFDDGHPEVVADVARRSHSRTALGLIVEGLERRRRAGRRPFTVLSCDNMPANGALVRAAVLGFAALRDAQLARWIAGHVAFPSSMVDRITPRTTDADRAFVERAFGVRDRWPVITEPFSQWIVEDAFCHHRPPLEEVGVQLVGDVRPYALAKTRLLNASHSALGYLGSHAGLVRTDEAMADPLFAGYVERMMAEEIAPLLPPTAGLDLASYRAGLLKRLANPAIGDRLSRLCRNGSTKVPRHIVATLREARAIGAPHDLLTLALAGWCRHLRGLDGELDDPAAGAPDDPPAARLRPLARAGGDDPARLLSDRATFGTLGDDAELVADLRRA